VHDVRYDLIRNRPFWKASSVFLLKSSLPFVSISSMDTLNFLAYSAKERYELDESFNGKEVLLRGRLHGSRATGKKMVFLVIREQFATVQAGLFVSE